MNIRFGLTDREMAALTLAAPQIDRQEFYTYPDGVKRIFEQAFTNADIFLKVAQEENTKPFRQS